MTTSGPALAPSLAERNRNVVTGVLEAAKAGDTDRFRSYMHPNLQVHEPAYLPYGGVYEGPEGFLRLFGEANTVLDLEGLDLISVTAGDDRAVMLMIVPLRATGELVHITEHWCVEDGLVTDVRVFWFEVPDFHAHADA